MTLSAGGARPRGRPEKRDVMNTKSEQAKIRAAIKEKYADISRSAAGKFAYTTGNEGARILGYETSLLSMIPVEIMGSFCGVGNPFLAGPINEGETVLDIGCGSGIDLIVASQYVGKAGLSCGIDITMEMKNLAKQNAAKVGLSNVQVREGGVEAIPYGDETFDVVISNGVLNLSPEKEVAFTEIFRVLARGGRVQFADIVLEGERPRDSPGNLEAWSD